MATTVTRWRPFADFSELRQRIDSALEDMISGEDGAWTPAIDLVEKKDRLLFRADLPGLQPDEVKIEVEGDLLTISGEHEEATEETKEDERYVRRERRYGSFLRSIRLPAPIPADQIEATCKDGVLEISIPKPAEAETKRVAIKPTTGE